MYKDGLAMHYKHPLFSTNVGLFHRNMASAYLNVGDVKTAVEQYRHCLR